MEVVEALEEWRKREGQQGEDEVGRRGPGVGVGRRRASEPSKRGAAAERAKSEAHILIEVGLGGLSWVELRAS